MAVFPSPVIIQIFCKTEFRRGGFYIRPFQYHTNGKDDNNGIVVQRNAHQGR